MSDLKLTRSSGVDFPANQPIKITYYMSFGNIVDFLIYEAEFYEDLTFNPDEEVIFDVAPNEGGAIKFTGVLYNTEIITKTEHLKLFFTSKFFKKMASAPPLFGSGNVSDIIESFYRKTGVPIVDKDRSDITLNNFLAPRTTTVDAAIQYLLNRAVASDAHLLGTIVGDTAYIRSVKKGREQVSGLLYTVVSIKDNRKRVDALGGLKLNTLTDKKDESKITQQVQGTSEIEVNRFFGVSDKNNNRARSKVQQLKVFFNNYTAVLTMPGWIPLWGSNIVVNDDDVLNQVALRSTSLLRGKYFVANQVLTTDYSKNLETTDIGVQLVEEL